MLRNRTFAGRFGPIAAIVAGFLLAASAVAVAGNESTSVRNRNGSTLEFAAQARPRVTIHPRRLEPRPDSKRQCVSWLSRENRASGPVVTPQMSCWWD